MKQGARMRLPMNRIAKANHGKASRIAQRYREEEAAT